MRLWNSPEADDMRQLPCRLALAGAFFAACVACTASLAAGRQQLPPPGSYKLLRIMHMPDGPVLSAAGRAKELSESTSGAITLLTFFYSTCADPEGCPVAWSVFQEVRAQVSGDPALSGKVRLVFMSLDPGHDTPSTMALFQQSYGEASAAVPWHFLTSPSAAELAPLLAGAGQEISEESGPAGQRAINHMLKVYLIDPEGYAREIYTTAFLKLGTVMNDIRTLAMAYPEASSAPPRVKRQGMMAWFGVK
jgi:protein SCO1